MYVPQYKESPQEQQQKGSCTQRSKPPETPATKMHLSCMSFLWFPSMENSANIHLSHRFKNALSLNPRMDHKTPCCIGLKQKTAGLLSRGVSLVSKERNIHPQKKDTIQQKNQIKKASSAALPVETFPHSPPSTNRPCH